MDARTHTRTHTRSASHTRTRTPTHKYMSRHVQRLVTSSPADCVLTHFQRYNAYSLPPLCGRTDGRTIEWQDSAGWHVPISTNWYQYMTVSVWQALATSSTDRSKHGDNRRYISPKRLARPRVALTTGKQTQTGRWRVVVFTTIYHPSYGEPFSAMAARRR